MLGRFANLVDRTTLTIFIIDFFFDSKKARATVVPMARKTSGNSPSLHQESLECSDKI